jgi:hypothetical protein
MVEKKNGGQDGGTWVSYIGECINAFLIAVQDDSNAQK